MATSNINTMSIYNKKRTPSLPLGSKKNFFNQAVLSTLFRHYHIFAKVFSVGCNNENKLQFLLTNGNFN